MEFSEELFWKFIKASLGDGNARWEVIDTYYPKIKKMCNGNRDMEHDIMISIYEIFDTMIDEFSDYLSKKDLI